MKQPHSIQVKFEVDQYQEMTKLVPKYFKNISEVVREATRIGLPWLLQPPKSSIAHEILHGLGILNTAISLFTRDVKAVRQLIEKLEKVPGNDAATFAPLAVRVGKVIQRGEALLQSIEDRITQLTPLPSLPHPVLLKLKTLAEQENERLLSGDPDRAVLKGLIKALHEMGVA